MTNEFDGFTENPLLPSEHAAAHPEHLVVECEANDQEIVLLCWSCEARWHTGIHSDVSMVNISHKRLLVAAQTHYGGEVVEFRMAKKMFERRKRGAQGVAA